ncbi:hypothetical protein PLESTB_000189800 [Pleodorina starrii]|uniref:Uncharacterized protein n=1 Tax=Pleodorina starrii TaxID=330485 RepID=A0A9W6EXQ2_9CHLO|nr:hypothetical protein PLESTM_000341300 [Pleodorina starrii]GLC49168.1 hypothetical protein PLESTB_000189800 [Pleodorina starrii]GLC73575.1 hypothetical protein PLESTF_001392900 [Pleodorina starrii]
MEATHKSYAGRSKARQTALKLKPGGALDQAAKAALAACLANNSRDSNRGIDARLAEAAIQELRALTASFSEQQGATRQCNTCNGASLVSPGLLALFALALRWTVDDRVSVLASQDSDDDDDDDDAAELVPQSPLPTVPAASVRPPASVCCLLMRSLVAFLTAQLRSSAAPGPPGAAGRAPATAATPAAASALLQGDTLQCYSHLLWAAHKRLQPPQTRRPSDGPVRDALDLLHEVSELLEALASMTAAAEPSLFAAQLASSSLLEHLARLLVGLTYQVPPDKLSPAGLRLEQQKAAALRTVSTVLAALAGGAPSASSGPLPLPLPLPPQRRLAFEPCMQLLLLAHTMGLCEAVEGWGAGGEGPAKLAAVKAAVHSALSSDWLICARRLPVWDEAGQLVLGSWPGQATQTHGQGEGGEATDGPSTPGVNRSPRQRQRRQANARPPPPPPPSRPSPEPTYLCTELVVQMLYMARGALSARGSGKAAAAATTVPEATPSGAGGPAGAAAAATAAAEASVEAAGPERQRQDDGDKWASLRSGAIARSPDRYLLMSGLAAMQSVRAAFNDVSDHIQHAIARCAFERARLAAASGARGLVALLARLRQLSNPEIAARLGECEELVTLAASRSAAASRGANRGAFQPQPELARAPSRSEAAPPGHIARSEYREMFADALQQVCEAVVTKVGQPPEPPAVPEPQPSEEVARFLRLPEGGWRGLVRQWWREVQAEGSGGLEGRLAAQIIDDGDLSTLPERSGAAIPDVPAATLAYAELLSDQTAFVGSLLGSYMRLARKQVILGLQARHAVWASLCTKAAKAEVSRLCALSEDSTAALRSAGGLLHNETALQLLCLRLARLGEVQWRHAAAAALATEATTTEGEAAGQGAAPAPPQPPPAPGQGQRHGPAAAAVAVAIREERLSVLVMQALLLAREAICSAWGQDLADAGDLGGAAGGAGRGTWGGTAGPRCGQAAARLRRLREWWRAVCEVTEAAAAAAAAQAVAAAEAWISWAAAAAAAAAAGAAGSGAWRAGAGAGAGTEEAAVWELCALLSPSSGAPLLEPGPGATCPGAICPDVEAALSAGVLTTLTRTMRCLLASCRLRRSGRCGGGGGGGGGCTEGPLGPSLVLSCTLGPLLADAAARRQILSYSEPQQLAALVDATGDAVRALHAAAQAYGPNPGPLQQRQNGEEEEDEEEGEEQQQPPRQPVSWIVRAWAGLAAACGLMGLEVVSQQPDSGGGGGCRGQATTTTTTPAGTCISGGGAGQHQHPKQQQHAAAADASTSLASSSEPPAEEVDTQITGGEGPGPGGADRDADAADGGPHMPPPHVVSYAVARLLPPTCRAAAALVRAAPAAAAALPTARICLTQLLRCVLETATASDRENPGRGGGAGGSAQLLRAAADGRGGGGGGDGGKMGGLPCSSLEAGGSVVAAGGAAEVVEEAGDAAGARPGAESLKADWGRAEGPLGGWAGELLEAVGAMKREVLGVGLVGDASSGGAAADGLDDQSPASAWFEEVAHALEAAAAAAVSARGAAEADGFGDTRL